MPRPLVTGRDAVRRVTSVGTRVGVGLLLTLIGCAGGEAGGAGVVVRDSAGVLIVEIGVSPDALPDWQLADSAELVLHADGGEDAPPFGSVSDAAWLPDGDIAVRDGQSREIHLFDGSGAYLRSLGGTGDGPGEFRQPVDVSSPTEDSIWVYDRRHGRLSLFHAATGFVRAVTLERDDGRPPQEAWALASGRFVAYSLRRHELEADAPYPKRASTDALLTLHDEAARTTSGRYRFGGPNSAHLEEGGTVSLPFANDPVFAVGNGHVVFGSGQAWDLSLLDPGFTHVRSIRWLDRDEPLSSDEVEAVRREMRAFFERFPAGVARTLEGAMLSPRLLPETRPAIGTAFLGPGRWLWVARFKPGYLGPHGPWYVLNDTGRPIGRVGLPPQTRLVDATEDRAMVVRTDSLDRQHVAVHELHRN